MATIQERKLESMEASLLGYNVAGWYKDLYPGAEIWLPPQLATDRKALAATVVDIIDKTKGTEVECIIMVDGFQVRWVFRAAHEMYFRIPE